MQDLDEMMKAFEVAERRVEAREAREKPEEHKLTKVTTAPQTYRAFFGGTNRDGEKVFFCVADHVNAAGYVLTWRETISKSWSDLVDETCCNIIGVPDYAKRRRQFSGSKYTKTAMALAKRRAEKFGQKMVRVLAEREAKRAAKAARGTAVVSNYSDEGGK